MLYFGGVDEKQIRDAGNRPIGNQEVVLGSSNASRSF